MEKNHIIQPTISIPLAFWFNNPIHPDMLESMLPLFASYLPVRIEFKFRTIDELLDCKRK